MVARKLSDSEKQQILELYRLPGETTSTLASRYGVSNSTISRVLKTRLPADEYEQLIQQKRMPRSAAEDGSVLAQATTVKPSTLETERQLSLVEDSSPKPVLKLLTATPSRSEPPSSEPKRRSRKRSSSAQSDSAQSDLEPLPPVALSMPDLAAADAVMAEAIATSPEDRYQDVESSELLEEILGDDLLDEEEDALGLDDELDQDDSLDDEDEDEAGDSLPIPKPIKRDVVQVLPLTQASMPRTCYLVVDRAAELIARPLNEFNDLGKLPDGETQEKTLPIFDNHRIAKRYANPRTQRVIKLPDGRILQKTTSHLQAKGITRLLIDGQVYAL